MFNNSRKRKPKLPEKTSYEITPEELLDKFSKGDPSAIVAIKRVAKVVHARENYLFLLALYELRNLEEPKEIVAKLQEIRGDFIEKESKFEINIAFDMQADIMSKIAKLLKASEIDIEDIFSAAEDEIKQLLVFPINDNVEMVRKSISEIEAFQQDLLPLFNFLEGFKKYASNEATRNVSAKKSIASALGDTIRELTATVSSVSGMPIYETVLQQTSAKLEGSAKELFENSIKGVRSSEHVKTLLGKIEIYFNNPEPKSRSRLKG